MPAGERNSRLWSWGWARGAPVPLAPQSECYIMWRTFCIAAAFASAEPWIVCVSELFWEGDRVNRGKRKEGRKEVKAETCCDCPRSKGSAGTCLARQHKSLKCVFGWVVLCQTGVQLAGIHKQSFCCWVGHGSEHTIH